MVLDSYWFWHVSFFTQSSAHLGQTKKSQVSCCQLLITQSFSCFPFFCVCVGTRKKCILTLTQEHSRTHTPMRHVLLKAAVHVKCSFSFWCWRVHKSALYTYTYTHSHNNPSTNPYVVSQEGNIKETLAVGMRSLETNLGLQRQLESQVATGSQENVPGSRGRGGPGEEGGLGEQGEPGEQCMVYCGDGHRSIKGDRRWSWRVQWAWGETWGAIKGWWRWSWRWRSVLESMMQVEKKSWGVDGRKVRVELEVSWSLQFFSYTDLSHFKIHLLLLSQVYVALPFFC